MFPALRREELHRIGTLGPSPGFPQSSGHSWSFQPNCTGTQSWTLLCQTRHAVCWPQVWHTSTTLILSICKPMIPKFISISDLFPECQTHLYNYLLDIVLCVSNRHHKVKMTKSGLLIWLSKCVLPLAFSVSLNGNTIFNCSSQKNLEWSLIPPFHSHPTFHLIANPISIFKTDPDSNNLSLLCSLLTAGFESRHLSSELLSYPFDIFLLLSLSTSYSLFST